MEVNSEAKAKLLRFLIVAFIVGYAICPDFIPGPIDDIIVILVGAISQNRIRVSEE